MERNTWLAHGLFVALVTGLLAVGYVQGSQPMPFLPWAVPEAIPSMLGFAAFILVSGGLFLGRVWHDEAVEPLDEPITAIVPTYRDSHVLHWSVESLQQSTHPVEVLIVCEPDDEDGIERSRELAAAADVDYLVNPNPGSKASAINAAAEHADTDLLGVFDADQEVPPDFAATASGHLREYDVVQSRFVTRPTGVVEALTYYEHTLFNYCFRQLLYLFTEFRMATSKAMLFTREAFESVEGYDTEVVSEDYDFAHQCYKADVDVKLLYSHAVSEESVHTLRDWWRQRKRWMLGNVEVLGRLTKGLRHDYRNTRAYVSLAIGLVNLAGSAFLISLVTKEAFLLATGNYVPALLPLFAIYAVGLTGRLVDGLPKRRYVWVWLLTPLVMPMFSLITLRAIVDYFFTWGGEWFHVQKGE